MGAFSLAAIGQMSGGGSSLMRNLEEFSRLYPALLGKQGGIPLVARNWVPLGQLVRSDFVLMPQNAWPWHGHSDFKATVRRRIPLRVLSDLSIARARAVIRIGESVPVSRNAVPGVLPNVLDSGFEEALTELSNPSLTQVSAEGQILCIGSCGAYRGLRDLAKAFDLYRQRGGTLGLMVAGPGCVSCQFHPIGSQYIKSLNQTLRRAEVLKLLSTAAVVVFPSSVELSPVTLLEATEISDRVLCSDIPGHHQVEKGVRYFPLGKNDLLANQFLQLEGKARASSEIRVFTREAAATKRREKIRQQWFENLKVMLEHVLVA